MNSILKKIIVGFFIFHLLSIIGIIIAFYVTHADTKALHILIYYLASFLMVYFGSVLCYLYVTEEGYETVLIS